MVALAQQAGPKVRFAVFTLVIQRMQWLADQMCHQAADHGIGQHDPHQVAMNRERLAEQAEGLHPRQVPQDHHERADLRQVDHQRGHQLDAQPDHQVDVLGNALVGVVRLACQPQAVEGLIGQPGIGQAPGHRLAPAQLQPFADVVHGHDDQHIATQIQRILADQAIQPRGVKRGQGVVEDLAPAVDQHIDLHHQQPQADHRRQHEPGQPLPTVVPERAAEAVEGAQGFHSACSSAAAEGSRRSCTWLPRGNSCRACCCSSGKVSASGNCAWVCR
ncbi:hypothetical protein D3C76_1048350 [compost metagenome]